MKNEKLTYHFSILTPIGDKIEEVRIGFVESEDDLFDVLKSILYLAKLGEIESLKIDFVWVEEEEK